MVNMMIRLTQSNNMIARFCLRYLSTDRSYGTNIHWGYSFYRPVVPNGTGIGAGYQSVICHLLKDGYFTKLLYGPKYISSNFMLIFKDGITYPVFYEITN